MKEFFMEYDINELIKYRVSKAKETMDDAFAALEENRLRTANNRIYYAIFYIVSALATKDGFSTSKHLQLMGWFNRNYINKGIIAKEFGDIYKASYKYRQESDYEDFVVFNKSDIEKRYYDMLHFVEEIEKLINLYYS